MSDVKADGQGLRLNTGKAPLHLVAPSLNFAVARVMQYGAQKYAPWNWARGMQWSNCYDAAIGHLSSWWAGQDIDEESQQPHLALAAANLMILIEYAEKFKEGDNRPKGTITVPSRLLPPKDPAHG